MDGPTTLLALAVPLVVIVVILIGVWLADRMDRRK